MYFWCFVSCRVIVQETVPRSNHRLEADHDPADFLGRDLAAQAEAALADPTSSSPLTVVAHS